MHHYLQVMLHRSLLTDVETEHWNLAILDLYRMNETNL